jgi:cytochrome c biogenesis protein CcmG/thiol:disulfide interchange protein DsbE
VSRLSFVIPAGVFLGLSLLFVVALFFFDDPRDLPSALVGEPLPAFAQRSLTDPERTVTPGDLRDAAGGRPYLLNVWATWCPTCRAEHEFLGELRERGVPVHGINYKDERSAALRWLDELGDPYGVIVEDPEGRLGLELGVYGAPETFVVDARGVIRHRHVGDVNARNFEATLGPLLESLGWAPGQANADAGAGP